MDLPHPHFLICRLVHIMKRNCNLFGNCDFDVVIAVVVVVNTKLLLLTQRCCCAVPIEIVELVF